MRVAALSVFLIALSACASSSEPVGQSNEGLTVCPPTVVEGLDVYDGQGTIDWASVASSGREFAFIKATQGDYNKQKTFAANWSGAKAAGVLRSPYHFFDPTIDGVTQAQWFLAEIDAQGGLEATDLPPMLDIECPTSSNQGSTEANCEYTGNSGWAPPATLAKEVFDWLTTVEQATGRKPIIYSYPSWFADVAFTDSALAQYPLFIASYGSCANVPAPWTSMVFWQYSATATVPGISGETDVDRFAGTHQELVALATAPIDDAGTDASADAADAEAVDAADASIETGADAGTEAPPPDGCGCGVAGRPTTVTPFAALLLVGLVRRRSRRGDV
ncbi:MAG TPA: GH25 family lysozyme [Polyangiaceae bacterium]|jgi:lysozyme